MKRLRYIQVGTPIIKVTETCGAICIFFDDGNYCIIGADNECCDLDFDFKCGELSLEELELTDSDEYQHMKLENKRKQRKQAASIEYKEKQEYERLKKKFE